MTIPRLGSVVNFPVRRVKLRGGPLDETVISIPEGPEVYRHLMRDNGIVLEYDVTKDIGEFLGEVGYERINR